MSGILREERAFKSPVVTDRVNLEDHRRGHPGARVQAESPVIDRWNEYMKDIMLMEMDPETGAQPLMKQVFFFD